MAESVMLVDKKVEILNSSRHNPLDSVYEMPRERGKKAEILAFLVGGSLVTAGFVIPPKTHDTHGSQPLTIQVGFLFWLGIVLMVGELLRRLCLLVEEVCHFSTIYSSSLTRLVLHVFGCTTATTFVSCIILLSFLFTSILEPRVAVEISSHWSLSLGIAGLYLVLISVAKISENLVDYDVILDDRLFAIGQGLAYSYYYGFLRIILPPGPTAKGQVKSLPQRAADFECEEHITLASKKLIILIPDTCFCLPSFPDMAPGQIENIKKIEDVVVARAGMKDRPYSASVYSIKPDGQTDGIYVMMEMPSILFVLYEMNTLGHHHSKLSSFERTKQALLFTKILRRLLDNDPSCKDTYEIIYYKDQNVNLAELVYEHVKNSR